jgi:two-component system, NtrC family, response regulator AtoC
MTEDLQTAAEGTAAAQELMGGLPDRANLVVYYGTGGDARTRVVELPDGAEVTFGRSRSCTVHVDSESVSRTHAKLLRAGDKITVEDLGSRNGTRVNGDRITGVTTLCSGDEVQVGPVTGVVTLSSRMPRRAPLGSTAYLEERLAAEVDRGLRFQRSLGLLMVRLEGDQDPVDAAVDRIAANLRPMDVLAEYGPDELALIFPEADRAAAEEVARRIAREANGMAAALGHRIKVRLGLAVFPEDGTQAGSLVTRARSALRVARESGKDEVARPPAEAALVGGVVIGDPQMERVFALVRKVADHAITVLINGETGVGKEVVAEELHRASGRRDKPFVRLNCASIPETLLESELFGHERGAFTGADRRKAGYFEAADGGTIFLDEIGEITPGIQSKLLRVLEEHKFTRVGGVQEQEVDVRVVCATNRDLEAEVARGSFREDLFFRISAFTILVPPLRDRPAEIPLLAEHFVALTASEQKVPAPGLSPAALAMLRRYSWPGNVRELRNAMERAVVLHAGIIEVEHLPDRVRQALDAPASGRPVTIGDGIDMRDQIAEVERATIVSALDDCGGNQTRAAQKLGLSRRALIYKLEKYGLKAKPIPRR